MDYGLCGGSQWEKIHLKTLLTEDNSQGELTINNLELVVYVTHLHIFAPLMKPLENIGTKVDNTSAKG